MRAILPGRPQSTRQALCTAHWDGLRLVAYVSGNSVIVLQGPRRILQTISIDDCDHLTAVTIEESSGRIAVRGDNGVHIYNAVGRDENDLRWAFDSHIGIEDGSTANGLSWGSKEELLVAGSEIWLYNVPVLDDRRLIWRQKVSSPIHMAHFSNDGELVATCGQHDRLVKIWRRLSYELDMTRFDVSYLSHPAAVTDFHWRKPWHAEQSLDSLLYTVCVDNQVRLWTYSDPHSRSIMQLVANIDTNASIQPRRLSVGSMSHRRFTFILDSRDLAQATERALQGSRQKQVDHAMEHLVEIANRSPEICVILDGVGHMSVWGMENVGCKAKTPPMVFNVALVDSVKMQLMFSSERANDYVRFCVFAGGHDPSSLSMLVHSYTGQVDWYESHVAIFLDTSAREQRVRLVSSWSGHDIAVDHIARGRTGHKILSWTDEGQAILWSQTTTGALQRSCEINIQGDVRGVVLLDLAESILVLDASNISLWSTAGSQGRKTLSTTLPVGKSPLAIQETADCVSTETSRIILVTFSDFSYQIWRVNVGPNSDKGQSSFGKTKVFENLGTSKFDTIDSRSIECDVSQFVNTSHTTNSHRLDHSTISIDGQLHTYHIDSNHTDAVLQHKSSSHTNVTESYLARASSQGYVAFTDQSGKALYVWSARQIACEWQHTFNESDHIQKMAWTRSPGGNMLLFVGFSFRAFVIGQARYFPTKSDEPWRVLQTISFRNFTTNCIGDACWLASGDLAIATGSQMFVLECACDVDVARRNISNQTLASRLKAAKLVDYQNCPLPVFHNHSLEGILLRGDYAAVRLIICRLNQKLKFFRDELDVLLDFELQALFADSKDRSVMTNGTDSADVAEVVDNLQDYLIQLDLPHISTEAQEDLLAFVKVFVLIDNQSKSLDDNALRYLYRFYSTPENETLPWSAFVFAFHSASQQALLDLIVRRYDNKLTWADARRAGLFVWLEDQTALQDQFENVARAEYVKNEDRNPVDCSLYYLALNKKAVLQGLWRRTVGVKEKDNTMKLLANNFDDPKWKATALKNAYALLSRRRFEYAAAFFLLGSSLKDAVNVCINQLDDPQLAIAITRVWTKDSSQSQSVFRDLLESTILPRAVHNEEGRWIAAWAYLNLNNPTSALHAILRPLYSVVQSPTANTEQPHDDEGPFPSSSFRANDPSLALLYPQIRSKLVAQKKWCSNLFSSASEERDFILRSTGWYLRAGLPHLALHLTQSWKFVPFTSQAESFDQSISMSTKTATDHLSDRGRRDNQDEKKVAETGENTTGPNLKPKPAPTQFVEPSASSLLDSFGF